MLCYLLDKLFSGLDDRLYLGKNPLSLSLVYGVSRSEFPYIVVFIIIIAVDIPL